MQSGARRFDADRQVGANAMPASCAGDSGRFVGSKQDHWLDSLRVKSQTPQAFVGDASTSGNERHGCGHWVWRAAVPRLGGYDHLQHESEGEYDGRAVYPQPLPIAWLRSRHRKHRNHDGEPDQQPGDEAARFAQI